MNGVTLWINNERYLYDLALDCVRRTRSLHEAAAHFNLNIQKACNATPENPATTPDGHEYTHENVLAAIRYLVADGFARGEE
jgi:hypothetical protein